MSCTIFCLLSGYANAGVLYLSQDSNGNGLHTVNTTTGLATLVGAGITAVSGQTVGLSPSAIDSQLLGTQFTGLLTINTDGSGAVVAGSTGMEGLAFNVDSGIIYAAINGRFFTVDPVTGANTGGLAAPGGDVEGLAYARDQDTIFGLANGGLLRSYSIAGNSWTSIGNTGIDFDQIGLAFDPVASVLYAVGDQDSNLYQINPLNAATAAIGSTGLADPGGGLAYVGTAPVPEPTAVATWSVFAVIGLFGARRRRASA